MDIYWTLTVQVPQLDTLTQALREIGEKTVASIDSIKAEMVRLTDNQAQASQALTDQVTRIADEVAQWNASGTPVTDEQMTNLENALRAAADKAAEQTESIRSNSEAIDAIIPDEAPPA